MDAFFSKLQKNNSETKMLLITAFNIYIWLFIIYLGIWM